MSIPRKIHYCWFGRNPKPKLAQKCIRSWKKKCPDYEIVEWNESNYDISSAPLYVCQAYESQKWAFVTDYVRLQVVYEHGGIYLDTDVELKKNLEPLLGYNAYFGFEDGKHINTGLGFGAEKGAPILAEMMEDYRDIPFIKPDGTFDTTTCPARNTKIFLRHGLKQDDSKQILDCKILILPSIYLCPMFYESNKIRRSRKTVSIHWFSASWKTQKQKADYITYQRNQRKLQLRSRIDYVIHLPNMVALSILGKDRYERLKGILKKG